MRIERIEVFQIDLKGRRGGQRLSGGRVFSDLNSTVVKLVTREGLIGWGESVPCGANYLPAFARGVRAGLEEIAPALIGENPLQLNCILEKMDKVLMGHPYVKSAVDIACWDLLGKATDLPVYVLLGGKGVFAGVDQTLFRNLFYRNIGVLPHGKSFPPAGENAA